MKRPSKSSPVARSEAPREAVTIATPAGSPTVHRSAHSERLPPWIAAGLMVVTFILFWPAHAFEFFRFDDPQYILDNEFVKRGLSLEGLRWAFGATQAGNWHPITWISHMLDCQLFGINAGRFHLVNVVFHSLNAALLFIVLREMTGALWRSAVVAGLFAFHPLHVESVAWISERKDVLSTLFLLLTIWSYVRHVSSRATTGSQPVLPSCLTSRFYLLSLVFFVLGLLSKPMLVTVPFCLLLLDYWPLCRWRSSGRSPMVNTGLTPLLLEKLPFFLLCAVQSLITIFAQKGEGAMASSDQLPLSWRVGNAVISYERYLQKMTWPDQLAFLYPHPGQWPATMILEAAVILLVLSAVLFWLGLRRRYFIMGWLWYLGTLVPVIGLVQVGQQSWADRYSYIPLLGPFIIVVWGFADLVEERRWRRLLAALAGVAVVAGCIAATKHQLRFWKCTEDLYCRQLDVAMRHPVYRRAFENIPLYANMHLTFATDWAEAGEPQKALEVFRKLATLRPNDAPLYSRMADALAIQGNWSKAEAALRQAARLAPRDAAIYSKLGQVLCAQRRFNEARQEFSTALKLTPDFADAHLNFGMLCEVQGRRSEAIAHLQEASRLDPGLVETIKPRLQALGASR